MPQAVEVARSRIQRVLEFLKRFQTLKTPPIRNISDYKWRLSFDRLPKHPSIRIGQMVESVSQDNVGAVDGIVLQVTRPRLAECPSPPELLRAWLLPGWNRIEDQPQFLEARNETVGESTITIRFDSDPKRMKTRDEWLARRTQWEIAEWPARDAEATYQRLYALYGEIERGSEMVRLMLGEGMLLASDVAGRIEHPVLLQRLELHFDPSIPVFRLIETDDPPELAMGVIGSVVDSQNQPLANSKQLAKCQIELSENPRIHPLGSGETSGFLARLVNGVFAKGQFVESTGQLSPSADVQIVRTPLVFLAPRSGAFSTAIDTALQRIQADPTSPVPKPLANLVGVELDDQPRPVLSETRTEQTTRRAIHNPTQPRDLLLTRPANPEQEQVIRQLDQSGMVLVQGPPGTGKTHTIANLIGHALAQGKTVLVTSHTAKALRVVREKIVPELQPLCVSLLATDTASRQELKQAVCAIGQQLGARTQDQLDAETERLRVARAECLKTVTSTEDALRQAIRDEYVDVIVGGEGTAPARAARFIAQWQNEHGWLPGPLEHGVSLPLAPAEITELYKTNILLTERDEGELACPTPDPKRMLTQAEFQAVATRINQLRQLGLARDATTQSANRDVSTTAYQQAIDWFETAVAAVRAEPVWYRECVEVGLRGDVGINDWTDLISTIEEACSTAADARSLALRQQVNQLPSNWEPDRLILIADEIENHLRGGGG